MTEKKTVEYLLSGIPPGLKQRFKMLCVRRGISMREALLDLIREEVEQDMEYQRALYYLKKRQEEDY